MWHCAPCAVIVGTHLMGSKFIPGFLVGWMMATFMPRMMTNQALKYRKYKGLK